MEQLPVDSLAKAIVIALGVGLFITTAIGFALKGPLRWVKIATVLLLADFFVLRGLYAGWQAGLLSVGILVGAVFATVSFAFLQWRHPANKLFSPAKASDCPAHGRKMLERWTRELEELGFVVGAEHRTLWRINDDDRITYVRFLTHQSEPLWVEIHVLDNPKIAARMAVSDKGDGRAAMTCDQQADQELFDDRLTTIQRVARGVSCVELVDAQRKLAMTTEGPPSPVEDPVRSHVEIYGGWVERLLAEGKVRRVDHDWIGLPPAAIPGLVLKTWAAWFH